MHLIHDAGKAAAIRQAGRMGINPNSGAFMNMLNQAQYELSCLSRNSAKIQFPAAENVLIHIATFNPSMFPALLSTGSKK